MNIVEIFTSIQGEGLWSGTPMTFVRFGGCNLDCDFCDTEKEGKDVSRDSVLEVVLGCTTSRVCITGGEPTLQKDSLTWLVHTLKFHGREIHIETNGTTPINYPDVWITVSPKPQAEVKIWHSIVSEWKILVDETGPLTSIPAVRDPVYDIAYRTPIFLQPVDPPDSESCSHFHLRYLDRIKRSLLRIQQLQNRRPELRLSLQLHKLLGVR